MAVDNFPTQFDKMTIAKDRYEDRTRHALAYFKISLAEMAYALAVVVIFVWTILKCTWLVALGLYTILGAGISRIRLGIHRRRIAKSLLKQYNA